MTATRGSERASIDRLAKASIPYFKLDPLFGKLLGRIERRLDHGTQGEHAAVRAAAQRGALSSAAHRRCSPRGHREAPHQSSRPVAGIRLAPSFSSPLRVAVAGAAPGAADGHVAGASKQPKSAATDGPEGGASGVPRIELRYNYNNDKVDPDVSLAVLADPKACAIRAGICGGSVAAQTDTTATIVDPDGYTVHVAADAAAL